MKNKTNRSVNWADEHTSASDFFQIFLRDAQSFYQLAFLLTGSERRAEECLLLALEDCQKAKVFKPWAESWSRLAVIERALKVSSDESIVPTGATEGGSQESRAILQLKGLDRSVFVLGVLEKYSVRDCAILLKTNKREIREIKARALRDVALTIGVPMVHAEESVRLTA